jgi:hypothetical protein
MSLSGIFKFIIGFIVGIFILAAGGAATAFYFWTKLSSIPPKPVFAEERPKPAQIAKKGSSSKASKPKASKSSTPAKPPAKVLPPGAYRARVTWPEGLSLRDAPSLDSNRIGGVAANQEVFILKASDDQKWQQIRLTDDDQEGWIKAGNTEKVN